MTLLTETTDELTNDEITALPTTAAGGDGDDHSGNNGNNGNGTTNGAVPAPMPGNVRASDIVGEMQTAYLDYAMSVIVSRALPDVRDGLKPVHRRILYAMSHDLYLHHTKPHRKSARIVGEVLGKYHPHGDVAVYDAMVRMAQEFSLRYPLVDGQGNFGSIDGDGAAAMRYTEARLAEISELMLADLDKDTVEWHDNFDNSLEEPDILPAALPNLLINGSSGIAVGMATNIPPHNLGEIVDALVYLIDRYSKVEEITVDELLHFVKGPDFPTGGILYRFREDKADENTDVIAQGYAMGKARLVMQAKAHFEEMSRGRSRIVVTELPYQTNKTALIERIASLARDGKIEGITDLRDESDRTGMRIVVELTRNADPKNILTDLFKYTPLQQTFGMQMLALVDGQPRLLSLKRALHLFVQHREEIIRRRSEYDLAKARDRAHIVEGLLKALDILDEVIATIRRSQTVETARNNLVKNFQFSEIQAQAILDMQLRRLAALERKKLKDEYDELMKRIAYLEDLLAHPEKILAVIREDLLAQKEKYGDARRTQIVDRTKGTLTSTDLLPQQEVWVTVSTEGDLRRQDVAKLDSATLGKMAKVGQVAMLTANTRDWLYLFCRDGRCTRIAIHEIPQNGTPKHVSELSDFTRRDAITAAISVPRIGAGEAEGYLFLATALGNVKRVTLADFVSNVAAEFVAITVEVKDRLQWVLPTPGAQEVMLFTATGQSIRFSEEDVRSMGLAAGGVGGIKLKKGDLVIHADVIDPARDGTVLTITAQGYAKRSALSDYSRQGRNGSGIVTHKPNNRTGLVTAAMVLDATVGEEELIAVVTAKKKVEALPISAIPVMGRGVQGKSVVTLVTNDAVVALKRITESTSFTPTDKPSDPAPDAGDGAAGNLPPTATSGVTAQSNGTVTADAGGQAPNGSVRGKTKRGATARKATEKTSRQLDATAPVATGQAEVERDPATPRRGKSRKVNATTGTTGTTAQIGESGRAQRDTAKATAAKTAAQATAPTGRTKTTQATPQAPPEVKSQAKPEATKQEAEGKTRRKRAASADGDKATHRQQPAATADAPTAKKREAAAQSTNSEPSRAKRSSKQPATAGGATDNGTHRQPNATDSAATTKPTGAATAGTQTGRRRSAKQAEPATTDSTPSAKAQLQSRAQAAGAEKSSNATAPQADSPKAKPTKSAKKTAADSQSRDTKGATARSGSAQAASMKPSQRKKSVDKLNRVTTNPQKAATKKTKKSSAETAEDKPQTLELFPLETVDVERKPAKAAAKSGTQSGTQSATKSSGRSQPTAQKTSRKLDAAVSMPNAKKKSKSR